MRPVRWSARAQAQLRGITHYLGPRNLDAAKRIVQRIRETGDALGRRAIGRPGPGGTYVKVVPGTSYLLLYDLSLHGLQEVQILRVYHSAQDWSSDPLNDR